MAHKSAQTNRGIQLEPSGSAMGKMIDELHDSASKGQLDLVLMIIESSKQKSVINAQNDQGWTALMFAARNGRVNVADALIKKGCDVDLMTKSGQTAVEIAQFWNHSSIVTLITGDSNINSNIPCQLSTVVTYFGKNPLDRCSTMRDNQEWIEKELHQASTKYILFHKLNPFVLYQDNKYEICPVSYKDISFLLMGDSKPVYIFLGLGCLDLSITNGEKNAWFALDVSTLEEEKVLKFSKKAEILSSKNKYAIMGFDEIQAGVIAQSKSLLTWHLRYRFCPTCGSVTNIAEAGYKRICTNKDCISLQGIHNTSYPRLDPVVIMLIISPDKQQCLLGRQKTFPPGLFSCLAGFMEPGETIEDAVRREVMEESGIKVDKVQYYTCQPWPMPMQLMIGCLAYATSNYIKVDQNELEAARWFPKKEIMDILTGHGLNSGAAFSLPPKQTIAYQLIKTFVGTSSNL